MSFTKKWVDFVEALAKTPTEELFDIGDAHQEQIKQLKERVDTLEQMLVKLLESRSSTSNQ